MKNKKVCPKCNSTDIVKVPGNLGNKIQVGWTLLSTVEVRRYVCCECGYSEEWIPKGDIQILKEKL